MKYIIVVLAMCFISCKKNVKKEAIETPKPVKLYVLDGGSVLVNKLEVFSQDTTYTGQTKQLADPYYVIAHPQGNLIPLVGLIPRCLPTAGRLASK